MPEEMLTSIERFVGGHLSPQEENALLRDLRTYRFDVQPVQPGELVKTEDEIAILNRVNMATNLVRNQLGLGKFDIPLQNVHLHFPEIATQMVVTPSLVNAGLGIRDTAIAKGGHRDSEQDIVLAREPFKLAFAENAFHEVTHFKGYGALQALPNGEIGVYRSGLKVVTRDGKKEYFYHLNEALTEELAKRYVQGLISSSDPLFVDEIRQTEEIKEQMFAYNTDFARQAITDEIMLVHRVDDETVRPVTFTYPQQRRALNELLAKLCEANAERFNNQEEVFQLFTKAYFTGNILTIGRLVDRTFGKGTFRQLGEPQPIDALSAYIASL